MKTLLTTVFVVVGLSTMSAAPAPPIPVKPVAPKTAVLGNAHLVAAARSQVGVTVAYDPAYRKLEYPGGDVPLSTGVCADVIVRALRTVDIDLQKTVHEDMLKNFSAYPKNWGLKKPDTNIDHRRVPNLSTWFTRAGWSLPVTKSAADYAPGDIVTWSLPGGLKHIGLVSDKKSAAGTPLVFHNIGSGAKEEDVLFNWAISGRFRKPAAKAR